MRPASSMSTLMPAVASWNAAMPPEAPLPTTITSQGPEVGLMDAASLRDSSVMARRSRSRVLSAGAAAATVRLFGCISGLRLLPAVRAILAVHRQAAHELEQDLVALVPQLLVDADLGGVVAVDGGLLGVREERLELRLAAAAMASHVAQQSVHL